MSIFNANEQELIDAARMILRDGVERLKGRQSLLPTNRDNMAARDALRETRDALTASLIADYGALRHEVAVAVLIDAQGRLIEIEQFPQGKATHVEVDCRILAGWVIKHGASSVVLAHNHPSGEVSPSNDDIRLTEMIGRWLAPMQCQLIEHLVLTAGEAAAIIGDW